MPKDMSYYTQQAGNQLNGQYAQQLQDLQNRYNQQKQQNSDQGTQAKNSYNNQTLARGLGRSSIATTGLAGIDNTTAKNLANLTTNYNQGVNGINTNKSSAISQLANNLYNTDYERELQQQQMAEQKRQFDLNYALQQQQLAAQKAAASRSSSGGGSSRSSSNSAESSFAQQFDNAVRNGAYNDLKAYLVGDNNGVSQQAINDLGYSTAKKYFDKFWAWQAS